MYEVEPCQCKTKPEAKWNPYDGFWECWVCGGEVVDVEPDKPKIYPEMEWL